jgi:hypothetical protein
VLKKYNLKGTVSVSRDSILVLKIKEGAIDFFADVPSQRERGYLDVSPYWIETNYTAERRDCLLELKAAMSQGNWNRSDISSDYFDVGWYVDIKIGTFDSPYQLK